MRSRLESQVAGIPQEALPKTTVIRPASGWGRLDLGELWRYRDLVVLMVRRDFVAQYAQTILGPAWYLIQPILTTAMFTLVFGRVASLPTDGVPAIPFYLAGIVIWSYFATCLTRTSATFTSHANLFGKVWFPRLVVPISVAISSLFAFAIQLLLLLGTIAYQAGRGAVALPGIELLAVPLLVFQTGLLGLGIGSAVSALTTRYRDLGNLVGFGVQLWMFATPVIYPASQLPERWRWLILANPMAPIVEGFRRATLGVGRVDNVEVATSLAITLVLLLCGLLLFTRVERCFLDTV